MQVIKAQPSNMTYLDDILQKNIRLIDYEKICSENGERLGNYYKECIYLYNHNYNCLNQNYFFLILLRFLFYLQK